MTTETDPKAETAIERNARSMTLREYQWLKEQKFQPPLRRALVTAYERIHGLA